jgi:hypothetical protein
MNSYRNYQWGVPQLNKNLSNHLVEYVGDVDPESLPEANPVGLKGRLEPTNKVVGTEELW